MVRGITGRTVLICNGRFFPSGGAESYLFRLSTHLQKAGAQVVPFAARYEGTIESEWEEWFVDPPTPGGAVYYRDYRSRLGIRDMLRLLGRAVYSREVERQLGRLIKRVSPDVVYVLNVLNALSPSVISAAVRHGVPCVVRLSDFGMVCASYRFYRNGQICQECAGHPWAALRYRCVQNSLVATMVRVAAIAVQRALGVWRRAHAVVCPSRTTAWVARQVGVVEERIHLVKTFGEGKGRRRSVGGGKYVGFLGRVAAEKGVDVLIRAHARAGVGWPLRIAGTASDDYGRYVRDVALKEGANVEFVGDVRGEEKDAFLEGAAVMVLPALWLENGPNALIEALCEGVPVVVSDVDGHIDYVPEGGGMVVERGNVVELARALESLWQNQERLEEMSKRAHAWARRELSPEQHLRRLGWVFEAARRVSRGRGRLPQGRRRW